MNSANRIDARIRAYGRARIDITINSRDEADWQRRWRSPMHEFPFTWGSGWKQCLEYSVSDYAAEVGFFIDVLGFPVSAFSPSYAQFTSPEGDFNFAVLACQPDEYGSPADAFQLQLCIQNLTETMRILEARGVVFEQPLHPIQRSGRFQIARFRTPHGIMIELHSEISSEEEAEVISSERPDEVDPAQPDAFPEQAESVLAAVLDDNGDEQFILPGLETAEGELESEPNEYNPPLPEQRKTHTEEPPTAARTPTRTANYRRRQANSSDQDKTRVRLNPWQSSIMPHAGRADRSRLPSPTDDNQPSVSEQPRPAQKTPSVPQDEPTYTDLEYDDEQE